MGLLRMSKHDELVLECAKCGYTSDEWLHFNEDEEELVCEDCFVAKTDSIVARFKLKQQSVISRATADAVNTDYFD